MTATESRTYWCEHAQLPTKVQWGVRLTVADGRITQIKERVRAASDDTVLRGVALPGFANAHSHAFHRALRGRTHAGGGTFWTWREEMYAVASRLDPDTYLALARAVFAEMLATGYTAVGDFHYLHHRAGGERYEDPNAMGRALIRAAEDVGIRLTLLDTCYLQGGLTPQGHVALDEVQERFSDGSVAAWAERVAELADGDRLRIGAAAHSVRALTTRELDEFADATEGKVVHAHVSEQPAENLAVQAFHGRTPVELLGRSGLLDENFTAVHATHLSERDLQFLEASGATVCFCPTTERDLADGIGPSRALRVHGVPICLGSDQHAVIDPFEELRGIEMHERLLSHERGRFRPEALIESATRAGYRSLGWVDGGRLAVGALADFIAVSEETRRTAGTDRSQIVFAATGADVSDVVVGGEHLVAGGEHTRLGPIDPLLVEAMALVRLP